MSEKRYIVSLTAEERVRLVGLISKGKNAAITLTKARILLKSDRNSPDGEKTDEAIMEALDISASTVYRVRKEFVEEGVESVLVRKRREVGPTPRILDGEKEAQLIKIACSTPPEGRTRWTLQLIADKLIELKIVDHISDDTVHKALKKTNLNHILKNNG